MIEQDVVGYLEGEDLTQYRVAIATIEAVRSNNEKFDKQESIHAHLIELVLLGTYYETFKIPRARDISVNPASGAITIDDPEDEEGD